MKSKSGSAAISKNFSFKPAGGISSMMWTGPGGQSPSMYEPAPNPSISKSAYLPSGNAPISKNFVEADRAAKAANKMQGGQTHSVMRRGW